MNWMDQWMIDGWMDEWDGWVDGYSLMSMDGWMNKWIDG